MNRLALVIAGAAAIGLAAVGFVRGTYAAGGSDSSCYVLMAEAFASEDAGYIAHALGVVARAKGMAEIAKETGLSREQLYRSFSENGNPTLKTTIAVMKALGIELSARPCEHRPP